MSVNALDALLEERGHLLADGATGTNLFAMGLVSGDAPEPWNVDHPDRVRALHRAFVDAGADLVLTNSFGGTHYRLALHGHQRRVRELNEAAAHRAREVVATADRKVLVAGSIGPTGELFAPLGPVTPEAGRAAFAEQAEALAAGGVDVIWIETMSSREEAEAALEGAAGTGLPVVCTLSFDTNGRTMMGIAPGEFASLCRQWSPAPHAFGTNCGLGPAEVVAGLLNFRATVRATDVLVAKANCGIPRFEDGEIRYSGTPALMAEYACMARAAGARIVGGCCGTGAEHVASMRAALDAAAPAPAPTMEEVVAVLGEVTRGAADQLHGAAAPARPTRRRRRPG